MVTLPLCVLCQEEYDNGGLLCERHEMMIDDDVRRNGQPTDGKEDDGN